MRDVLVACPLAGSTADGRTLTACPPGASKSYTTFCISGSAIASYAYLMPLAVIFLTLVASPEGGKFLSMTCVAPRDPRYSSLCKEAVVMMGEKPEILANCITDSKISSWAPFD